MPWRRSHRSLWGPASCAVRRRRWRPCARSCTRRRILTSESENLKKAILECIDNPDEVTRRGKNARKKAEKYTWQEKKEKYQAIYE